jgi:hypothetical protein
MSIALLRLTFALGPENTSLSGLPVDLHYEFGEAIRTAWCTVRFHTGRILFLMFIVEIMFTFTDGQID